MNEGLFLIYLESYLQALEKDGKISRRTASMVRGYYRLGSNPRNSPLLDEFIVYIRATAPEEAILRDEAR